MLPRLYICSVVSETAYFFIHFLSQGAYMQNTENTAHEDFRNEIIEVFVEGNDLAEDYFNALETLLGDDLDGIYNELEDLGF